MIETVIKSPLLPDTIHFNHTMDNQTEVMRITRDGVWVNPDMQVDEIATSVLHALDYQVKVLVQRAVEDEREACAVIADKETSFPFSNYGDAIRARGKK